MARIRTIKPEFPQSQSMGRVSRDARLTFVLLWTLADDSGRLRGNSRMLASLLFPYDDDAPKLLPKWMAELEREKSIVRYVVDSCDYVQICNWLSHQKIDKPSQSKLPAFANVREDSPTPLECSSEDQGPRTKDQGRDQGEDKDHSVSGGNGAHSSYSEDFETFWQSFSPVRKTNKPDAWKAWKDAIKSTDAQVIIQAAIDFSLSPVGMGEYCPGPAPWLRGKKWEDDRRSWQGAKRLSEQLTPKGPSY